VHKKIEKVAGVLRGLPDLPRRLEDLNAVLLQLAIEQNAIAVFQVRAGRIADPFFLRFAEMQSQPRSIEAFIREKLLPAPGDEAITNGSSRAGGITTGPVLEDHLSLLARWFYGKPRLGEIFFAEPDGSRLTASWPYRRIIRACSRLLAPPAQPMSPAPETPS
jgi:hypothetical protein